MSQWISIESRQALSSADEAVVARLNSARQSLDRLTVGLPSTLLRMRDWMAGQPKAASPLRDGSPVPWCWAHERTTRECDEEGLGCEGEVITGPSDPTGTAAVEPDRAARHHRDVCRRLDLIARAVAEVEAITSIYPVTIEQPVDSDAGGPGEEWCRCCWKDRKYCEPITLRPDGQPWYRGMCRWCGQATKVLGGEPPTWLVAKRHRGDRIGEPMMAVARKEVGSRAKTKKKRKQGSL